MARLTKMLTSIGIKRMEHYASELMANGSVLMLADVNPRVYEVLKRSGALEVIGAENVYPATSRVLAAENTAWVAAQDWLKAHATSSTPPHELNGVVT